MEALHDVIEETVDPDFVNHSAATFEDTRGQDGVKNVFGSFRAEFVGLAPTGQRVEVTGINIDRKTNGRFVERWYEMDRRASLLMLWIPARSSQSSPRMILPNTYQQSVQNLLSSSSSSYEDGVGGAKFRDLARTLPTRPDVSYKTTPPGHFGAGTISVSR